MVWLVSAARPLSVRLGIEFGERIQLKKERWRRLWRNTTRCTGQRLGQPWSSSVVLYQRRAGISTSTRRPRPPQIITLRSEIKFETWLFDVWYA